MEQTSIKIGSVTYAQKAQTILTREKIASQIIRTRNQSCGFAVLVPTNQLERAKAILKTAGVKLEL